MKITSIDFLPLRLEIGKAGSLLGTDASPEEQRNASPEMMAAQRYAPP